MNINDSLDKFYLLMPNIFFFKKDLNSVYTDCSDSTARLVGIKNRQSIQGETDLTLPAPAAEFGLDFQKEDQLTIKNEEITHFLNCATYSNNVKKILFVTKNVMHDKNSRISGIFGYAQDVTSINYFLSQLLLKSSQILGKKNHSIIINDRFAFANEDQVRLTKRESETLFLLLRGETIKGVANYLNLSPRTIECYINNLREKFHCNSKSELICRAIDAGFLDFIPPSLLSLRNYSTKH